MSNFVLDNYDKYTAAWKTVWQKRFTWAQNGKYQKPTISIMAFNKATGAFANMNSSSMTADKMQGTVSSIADKYVDWVKTFPNTGYGVKDYDDMRNFFVGAIGEYFFFKLISEVRCILAPNNIGELVEYNFHKASPTLSPFDDFGVDLYFYANDVSCVGQVKFWNRFTKHDPGIKVIQSTYAEGVAARAIDPYVDNNVFLFFLGNESSIHSNLAKEGWRKYKKNVVPIGHDALSASIDNRNKMFWHDFVDSISSI